MQYYPQEKDLALQKQKTKRCQLLTGGVCLAGLGVFIALCAATGTANAAGMLPLACGCLAVTGWAALFCFFCLLQPARALLTHWQGLLTGPSDLWEGELVMTEESIRIPRSVTARRALLKTGQEEVRLNLDEEWLPLLPPNGTRVRVRVVHRFVTGIEVLAPNPVGVSPESRAKNAPGRPHSSEDHSGPFLHAGKRKHGILRRVLSLLPFALLWSMMAVLLGGFVFNQITETDPAHKITLFAETELNGAPALAARLEKDLSAPIRMVKIHPFSYAMFNTDALRGADLYIVSATGVNEYREWFAPLPQEMKDREDPLQPDGIRVFDPETGLCIAGDTFLYETARAQPEPFWLFFGKQSLHLTETDRTAVAAALLLLSQ